MHRIIFILTVCWLFIPNFSIADTHNAVNATVTAVQSAIDASESGDTVTVPPGNETWLTTLNIPSNKKITLQGAGIGVTTITANTPRSEIIDINESGASVTGFTFIDGHISINGKNWRIHHNRFYYAGVASGTVYEAIVIIGDTLGFTENVKGLVDNNQFHNMRVVTSGGPALMANEVWGRPLGLGTDDAVYVEDNVFTYELCTTIQAMDANYGGSYVFRYNTVQDASVMAHAVQANNRATRKWEVYGNVFWASGQAWVPGFMRAGTGVWFDNALVGGTGTGAGKWSLPEIIMDEQRSCEASWDTYRCGDCDGGSSWDGNDVGESGYPCRDQIGRSTDVIAIAYDSDPGAAQAQELVPVYAWNNFIYPTDTDRINETNGVVVLLTVKSDICALAKAHILSGRDFVNNGTTPKPGYTPYIYPHPLRNQAQYGNTTIRGIGNGNTAISNIGNGTTSVSVY